MADREVKDAKNTYYFGISPHVSTKSIYDWYWSSSEISKTAIEGALRDPYSGYDVLRKFSERIAGISTFYNNYLEYLSNMLTFDYFLYPTKDGVDYKEYNRLTKMVAKFDVKSFPTIALYDTLKYGESYWYPITSSQSEGGNKTMYQKIPASYCRVYEKDNYGVYRYQIDVSRINEQDMPYMPSEIISAKIVLDSANGKNDTWYTVRNGFALLAHLENVSHDYPYLSHIFPDLLSYEENKDYYDEFMKEDAVKMVHNKVPLNKENNEPLMDFKTIRTYHEETKKHVPKNVSVATNPFDATALTFDKNSQIQSNIVEQSKVNIENGSGINGFIFNSDRTTAQILEKSMQKDANNMLRFLPEFANIFNWLLRSSGCKISFVDSTKFNKNSKIDSYGKNLNNGGSRLQYVAYTGLEPYEFLQLADIEKLIDVDSLLPPKAMSAQLSGSADEDVGAPVLDDENLTDDGENSREKA